ncbi:MAG: DUF882 domain-containing protein [Alphaproteobacteria bacterium]
MAGMAAAPVLGCAWPSQAAPIAKTLAFENLHTHETLRTTFWQNGRLVPESAHAIDHILRDHRTGDIHPIETDLLHALYEIRHRLMTDAPFQIISGYRSPRTNTTLASASSGVATRSLHLLGQAIDIRVPGVPLASLHRTAVEMKAGGVGLYRSSDFVHIDVGPVRYW